MKKVADIARSSMPGRAADERSTSELALSDSGVSCLGGVQLTGRNNLSILFKSFDRNGGAYLANRPSPETTP